jgi:hypothetical protein
MAFPLGQRPESACGLRFGRLFKARASSRPQRPRNHRSSTPRGFPRIADHDRQRAVLSRYANKSILMLWSVLCRVSYWIVGVEHDFPVVLECRETVTSCPDRAPRAGERCRRDSPGGGGGRARRPAQGAQQDSSELLLLARNREHEDPGLHEVLGSVLSAERGDGSTDDQKAALTGSRGNPAGGRPFSEQAALEREKSGDGMHLARSRNTQTKRRERGTRGPFSSAT